MKKVATVSFPSFSGIRCLMMPFIQGEPESLPVVYQGYSDIIAALTIRRGDVGYLTIDESEVLKGSPHRGDRAQYARALHTEVGRRPDKVYVWGGGGWGDNHAVTLDADVEVLLANNLDGSCALWDAEHHNTSADGDIGYAAKTYPYSDATLMKAGEVFQIGILTPHESLPVKESTNRQFLRIISSGVHGREPYFTANPLLS